MDIKFDVTKVIKGLEKASDKYHKGIALYGQTASLKMEAYAKQNAPWTDRTSNARQTLKGISGWGYISATTKLEKTGKKNQYGDKMKIASFDNPNKVGYGTIFTVGIAGNMPYSVHLEFNYGQKYSILWPTIYALQAETIKGWGAMLNKLK